MAKMFYTLDETRAALGRNEEEIKQLTREGRLREFRDGPRLMFKADQVEQLKNELGGSSDQISLNPTDSGAPIGLVDSRNQSGSGLGISLTDSESPLSGSGMQMQMKDDTALASDLGLSGSVGGMPSPGGRAGGSVAGGSLTGMSNTGTGRGGINVFGADDSVEHADPLAQTAISPQSDQVSLESVGSGSGLLDLTRESDDTSLGAELLDEIAPGTGKSARRPQGTAADTGVGTGVAGLAEPRRGVIAPPVYVEAPDPAGNAVGWMAFGAALVSLVGALVLTSAVIGTRPAIIDQIAGMPTETRSIWILLGGGLIVSLILGAIGFLTARK
jgi:hypothetical protein